jgi:acyl dehydratase
VSEVAHKAAGPNEPVVMSSVQDVLAHVGQVVGRSEWHDIDQARIDRFALASGDQQWIHVDPVRAAQGPFGACVAHGLLTLSMAGGVLFHEAVRVQGRMGVNYGCDRVRYPAPVRVGSRIRAVAMLVEATALDGHSVQMTVRMTVDMEGGSKPACVADFILRFHF